MLLSRPPLHETLRRFSVPRIWRRLKHATASRVRKKGELSQTDLAELVYQSDHAWRITGARRVAS